MMSGMPVELHVEETGSGAPLVALHGFGASTYTWREVLGSLARCHHVYAVDLLGAGLSAKPRHAGYSMRDQAARVVALIDARGLQGITLVGHSFGGGVALLVALELIATPGRLAKLVLFDSPAYQQALPGFIRALRLPVIGPLIQHLTPLSFQVRTVLRAAFYDHSRFTDEVVAAYAAPLGMPGGREALRATALQIVPPDIDAISARYATIDVPTLIVWGRHDRIVPVAIAERLNQAIPGSRLIIVDDCGHVPHEELPQQVRAPLDEFLCAR